jgi:hypothetical protein
MNKLLLLTLVSALSLGASAQTALPYTSSMFVAGSTSGTGVLDTDWISVDLDDTTSDDNKSWEYGVINSEPAAKITVAKAYTKQNDWLISPVFHLEAGHEYKLAWTDYIKSHKNMDYNVTYALDITDDELAALQADDATVTYETALTSRLALDASLIKSQAPTNQTVSARAETITVATTGDYRFGFCFSAKSPNTKGGSLWLNGFSLAENILKPAAVTDLTATADAENMTVTLAWTLPTLDDTGAALAEGALTAVKVYRGDELIATLEGTATTYADNLEDAGFYTYSVAAVATAEGDAVSVTSDYVGTIGAQELPYFDNFSDTQMTPLLWTIIDANADGTTWNYYNSGGTTYYQYVNQLTDVTEDDWLVSPELIFDKVGVYGLTTVVSNFEGHLSYALASEKTAEALAAETAKIGESTYDENRSDRYAEVTETIEFVINTTGNNFIGIHNDVDPSKGMDYSVKSVKVEFLREITDAINSVAVDARQADNTVYNLQGMRVSNPGKGLYIVNGKKTILK